MTGKIISATLLTIFVMQTFPVAETSAQDSNAVHIRRFLPEKPISRAQRPTPVSAIFENAGESPVLVAPQLSVPENLRILSEPDEKVVSIESMGSHTFSWTVEAAAAGLATLRLEGGGTGETLEMRFLHPVEMNKLEYIPEPVRAESKLLVGAHHCPLWEADRPEMWSQIIKHPERTPALGFYSQENPEVSDWETKWAVEHGIDFFIYCWYRSSQGGPVTMHFGSAIHDALFQSRFVDKIKFTIMWENQQRGKAGVADEQDLMGNLMPFWMEHYFKHPGYLKVDNKPVLFIYRPEFLADDLGSVENVMAAFEKMREACVREGFSGLYLLGEYRGADPKHLELMRRLGLDYTFAYVWYVPDNPTPQEAIASQMRQIRQTQDAGILPQVVTVSQAWSGWHDEGTIWKIPPAEYKTLLREAEDFIGALPAEQLGSRMLLLDNWNEWGEGHYIAPYREYGFGYLDAVREVLTEAPHDHTDLIPEDIGLGPYDRHYRKHEEEQDKLRAPLAQRVRKEGPVLQGLVGWWAFDEEENAAVAFDWSGHGFGGLIRNSCRAPGLDGNALVCGNSGWVEVPANPHLSPVKAVSISCWVKSEAENQDNKWFINCVFNGATSSGYRMGVLHGCPCFEVPLTEWSHHLITEDPLPVGVWTHLVGVFDGTTMRLYVNGAERASMERPGPVNSNQRPLILGNYDKNHASFFTGLLDEVRLYNRALTPEEIKTLSTAPHVQ